MNNDQPHQHMHTLYQQWSKGNNSKRYCIIVIYWRWKLRLLI